MTIVLVSIPWKNSNLGAVWLHFFDRLHFFDHSIFITHHSSLNFSHPFGIITQFPSLNIFHTICEPIPVSQCSFFFLSVPKLTEANIYKKKKEKKNPELKPEPVEKKKKKNRTANLGKKKSQSGQKLRLVLFMGPSYVFNYKNAIELWVMETENSQNVFLVSITHNSKIRKLSNGNRVIVCQTTFLLWIPPFFSYELWKLRIELSNLPIQTPP